MLKTPRLPIQVARLTSGDVGYPSVLLARLRQDAPAALATWGNLGLLSGRKTAFFCSARTPGNAILRAHDVARQLRDEGKTVISGFHSPIEQDCLKILLRGKQPIIICPARSIETMRLPKEWRSGIEAGRSLLLSPFPPNVRRATVDQAERRNRLIAALADEVVFAFVAPGGQAARLYEQVVRWEIPARVLLDSR